MNDYYLKDATQADLDTVLTAQGLIDAHGNPTAGVSLDRIGVIYVQTGTDKSGNPIMTSDGNYYANVRLMFQPTAAQDTALTAIDMRPATPYRTWAD